MNSAAVAVDVLPDEQVDSEPAPPPRSRDLRWMWPAGFHPARAYLIVFVISTFVVSRWFRAGTFIATGDMGPFIRQGWEPGVLWAWSYQITGAGSATHTIGRAFEFLLIFIAHSIGLEETAAQWMFYTIIYGLVGFGVAYAAGAVVRSEWGIVVAGTFGVLNGFFLTRIPNPLNIISVGTVALITGITMRVAQGRTVPTPIAGFAYMPVSFLAFNPPMFVVATIWAGLGAPVVMIALYGRKAIWPLIKWYVLAAPWLVLLNLWWLVPFLQVYTGGGGAAANATFMDPTNWTWSQVNNQVPNVLTLSANWAWYLPQYLPFAADLDKFPWIWMRYMLPVLVFAAPLAALASRRRIAIVLLGMAGLFVFLAKGLMPPLANINLILYLKVPMFWLFREPMSKLGQLLVTFFGVLLAIAVEGAIQRWREQRPKPLRWPRWLARPDTLALVGTAFAAICVVAWPYPVSTGTVIPDQRPMQPAAHVRVPQFWWDTAEVVNNDPSQGKVLVLPLDDYYQMPTKWGFFGVDSIGNLLLKKGAITPKPDGYFGDVPGYAADVRAVQTGLLSGDLAAVPRMLDASGIDTIIVRHDLVKDMPGRTFADDTVITKALKRVDSLTRVQEGELDIWKADPAAGEQVRAYNKTLSVGARPDAAAAVIGSVGTGTAAIALKSSAKPPMFATVDNTPQVTNDTVQWPVPAVQQGSPKTTVKLLPGDYVVAQRARAAAVLVPSLDTPGEQLVFTDRTKVRVDGTVVSSRPPLKVPVPTTDIVAVQMGPRALSLDGWGREAMPRKPGAPVQPASAPVGAATPLIAFGPSTKPAQPLPPSEVYDCNNYEPRPADELKLRKQVLRNSDGEFIRLSAIDHAACTRIEIPDAKPGRTYRVRLEYRVVQGKRPQICLWQVGTDGCELTPRPMMNAGWHPFERIVTVDEDADKLILVLHADVGERLLGKSVTDYRDVSIEALDPVLETEIWPPEIPQRTVKLDGGKHQLSLTGGLSGTALAEFEPLQDCFRYDDKTTDQAGLFAKTEGDLRDPTVTLGARDHMACLGSTVPDMGQSSLYKLSIDSRSVNNRNPKFCLYLRGPDACEKIPTAGPWIKGEWSPYATLVAPNRKAVETRVYVYGLRDLKAAEQSIVEYKNIRLTPVASPSSIVLVRQTYGGVPDVMAGRTVQAEYKRVSPIQAKVQVGSGAMLLGFTETGAKGWNLTGFGAANPAQGWMASWQLDGQAAEGTIRYLPAGLGRKALYLLAPVLLMSFVYMLAGAWWRRRRARKAAAA